MREQINEIAKLYSEGATLHQAIHRGVGQQSQRLEKDHYWEIVVGAVKDYEKIYEKDIGLREIKKEYDDRSLINFLFGWADEMDYQSKYKIEENLALNAMIVSRLLVAILEGV